MLINCDESVESFLGKGKGKQLAILNPRPTCLRNRYNLMTGKQ